MYWQNRMSMRACQAYEEGKKPYSIWKKQDIISELEKMTKNESILNMAKACNVDVLRKVLLRLDEYHHTSARYNITYFYSVRGIENNKEEIQKIVKELMEKREENKIQQREKRLAKKKAEENSECYRAYVSYRIGGYKKSYYYKEMGIIQGKWCYLNDGHRRSIEAKCFEVLERYEDLPKDLDVKNITEPKYEYLFEKPQKAA